MTSIHLQLLGDFCLTFNSKPVTKLDTPRLRALVAYLALHRHAPQTRHHLAFLFWPDSSEAQALTNLRKQLLYLRSALPDADTLLQIERQTVQWHPTAAFGLDVAEFEATLARAAAMAGEQAIHLLLSAVDLYHGDLVPECYDEWIFPQREALREQYAGALTRLIQLLEEQRDYPAAIAYAQRLLRHDPLHEPTYRCLMRLHALNGDRPTALRIYHTCVTQLREELGVDPDDETRHSYERLLHGEAQGTQPAALAANAPFVGRQTEWQQLQLSWRMAMSGQPHFVLIAGEAGIGKTRLAEELLTWAIHQGFGTARTRCYAAEGQLTYAPIIDWLRAGPLRAHRPKVAATWRTELARLLPELLQDDPTLPRPEPMTQSWQRRHLFEAIARTLLAAKQSLLLLVDDLQWCDQETLECLHFLSRLTDSPLAPEVGSVQLLVVGTARFPDEVDATHPLYALLNQLRGGVQLTQIDLARLNEAETSTLAQQMAQGQLNDQTLQQLYADTAGNPLFVVETMRATQGNLPTVNGRANQAPLVPPVVLADGDESTRLLPPKVLAMLQARLSQLSATARELCAWAAIIGQSFTLELLVQASKISVAQAVAALDELWRRRIISEHGATAYDFSHDRLRDVALVEISRVRRRHLHYCVAEALENQNANQLDSMAAQIAAHYEAAGIVEKAINYYEQAGCVAVGICATEDAIRLYERSLALLTHLRLDSKRNAQELKLQLALAPLFFISKGWASLEVERTLTRALVLQNESGDTTQRIQILYSLQSLNLVRARYDKVLQLYAESEKLSLNRQKEFTLPYANGYATVLLLMGQPLQARNLLDQIVAIRNDKLLKEMQDAHGFSYQVFGHVMRSHALWCLGYPQAALANITAATDAVREHGLRFDQILAMAYLAMLQEWSTDLNTFKIQAEAAFVLTSEYPSHYYHAWAEILVQFASTSQQPNADNVVRLRRTIQVLTEATKARIRLPYYFSLLVRGCLKAGRLDDGLDALERARTEAQQNNEHWWDAELFRLDGELRLAQGAASAVVEAAYFQAIKIAQSQAAKSLELRAAMSLARLWAQQGKQGEAHTLLAEIYGWFTEGFDTPDLQEAKALLKRLA